MLTDINFRPTTRQLRQFAASTVVMLPLVTWLWTHRGSAVALASVAALIVALLGIAKPIALKPVFVGMSLITWPIGRVVSEVVVLLLFYAVFVPAGLLSQLLGRDPLAIQPKANLKDAWKERRECMDSSRYYRMS